MAMRIDFVSRKKSVKRANNGNCALIFIISDSTIMKKAIAMIKHSFIRCENRMCLFPSPFAWALKAAESQRIFSASSTPLIYQARERNRRKSSRKANVSENKITSEGRKKKSGQSGLVNPRANEVKQIMKVDDIEAFNKEAFKKKLSNSDR